MYVYVWGNNPVRRRLVGKRCRLLATGRMNTVAIEMVETGERIITDRRALRALKRTTETQRHRGANEDTGN